MAEHGYSVIVTGGIGSTAVCDECRAIVLLDDIELHFAWHDSKPRRRATMFVREQDGSGYIQLIDGTRIDFAEGTFRDDESIEQYRELMEGMNAKLESSYA